MASALALAAVSACSPAKSMHDKDYYAGHDADRTAEVTACQKSPSEEANDPNCVNAVAAQADLDRKNAWDLKPPAPRQSDPGKL